jgi:calcineurin-like phosphoesterase
LKILFIGDIIGRPGRQLIRDLLPRLVDQHMIDLVIANGENAAAGFGLTPDVVSELFDLGVDVLTTGNHVWDKRDGLVCLDQEPALLRPANYPEGAPGRGVGAILDELGAEQRIVFVDFHAEATSEKGALGAYLDGRVSAMVGTHTHVQTADERVMPGGTAFISDVGMSGARDSVIGIRKELSVQRFLTQMPVRYEIAKKDPVLCGVVVSIDESTGRARQIERVMELGN